ncbi:MAG: DUF6088 family protein [Rhodothermales bacterium]
MICHGLYATFGLDLHGDVVSQLMLSQPRGSPLVFLPKRDGSLSGKGVEISDTLLHHTLVQNVTKKILSRVHGRGRGCAFLQINFTDIGGRDAVDQALSRLARRRSLRRLVRGLYDYPRYSDLLAKTVTPAIQEVARPLARKHMWDLVPDKAPSLHLLGLDTQVPAQYRFLSSGPNAEYKVGGIKLAFVHGRQQRTSIDDGFVATLVQAIHALGQRDVQEQQRTHLASFRSLREYERILRQTRNVASWVHEEIKRVSRKGRPRRPAKSEQSL